MSVLEHVKHIWKPYLYGMLGAVALALIVAALGGFLRHALIEPSTRPSFTVVLPFEQDLQLLMVLATIIVCAALLSRLNIVSTLLSKLNYFVRHREHD